MSEETKEDSLEESEEQKFVHKISESDKMISTIESSMFEKQLNTFEQISSCFIEACRLGKKKTDIVSEEAVSLKSSILDMNVFLLEVLTSFADVLDEIDKKKAEPLRLHIGQLNVNSSDMLNSKTMNFIRKLLGIENGQRR